MIPANQYLDSDRDGIQSHAWVVVWFLTFIMIFETELRSIGKVELTQGIGLLPGIWLSDLGLVLPIIYSYILNRTILLNKYLLPALLIIFYGITVSLIHGNSLNSLGYDLRVILSVFSGISLTSIIPKRIDFIARSIILVSILCLTMILLSTLQLSDYDITNTNRIVSEAIFTLTGLPLILLFPSMLLAMIANSFKYTLWMFSALLIIMSLLYFQTRSLVISIIFALLCTIISSLALTTILKRIWFQYCINLRYIKLIIFIMVTSVIVFMMWRWSNVEAFIQRTESYSDYSKDENMSYRAIEAKTVFESMDPLDLLTGIGIGPDSPLHGEKGENYASLHIGILNIWWRFGIIPFLFTIATVIKLFILWLKAIFNCYCYYEHKELPIHDLSIIICAPGFFSLIIISVMSGGWAVSSLLPVGILFGIYKIFTTTDILPEYLYANNSQNTSRYH